VKPARDPSALARSGPYRLGVYFSVGGRVQGDERLKPRASPVQLCSLMRSGEFQDRTVTTGPSGTIIIHCRLLASQFLNDAMRNCHATGT
jgi:hypothetical protein